MPKILWGGKLSPKLKLMVNYSNAVAWVTGNARDTAAMKHRMEKGYDGSATDDITRYDQLGFENYTKISKTLLEGKRFDGQIVLDVGCGTGILSLLALEHGAAKIVCGDLSSYMLSQCEKKAKEIGYKPSQMVFQKLDAESLPFESNHFDAVISGMVLGLVPNQKETLAEMARVLKPGGMLFIATHGPDMYFEAIETSFTTLPKSLTFGYRVEFWPLQENNISRLFSKAGLVNVSTNRMTWKEYFDSTGEAYDFFVSTSSGWWYTFFPPDKIGSLSQKVRTAFEEKGVRHMTSDVVFAHGSKP